jgi:hypothetical protein
MQQRQLPLPPHERALDLRGALWDPGAALHQPLHGVDGQRRLLPVERQAPTGLPAHLLAHQGIGRRTHQECPGGGALLEPGRHGDGLAHGQSDAVCVSARIPDHHQPRMQSQAERHAVTTALRGQGGGVQALAQLHGREHRPSGMVLLGYGRAKHGRKAHVRRR